MCHVDFSHLLRYDCRKQIKVLFSKKIFVCSVLKKEGIALLSNEFSSSDPRLFVKQSIREEADTIYANLMYVQV